MNNKRKQNTIFLSFKFVGITNCKPSRVRITQSNTAKSIMIETDYELIPIDFYCKILDNLKSITSYQQIIDSTQDHSFIFVVNFEDSLIPDFLGEIKECVKWKNKVKKDITKILNIAKK